MPSSRQRRGSAAEDRAVVFLQKKGYAILARHVTSRFGEIDILTRTNDTVVAVEVKFRATDSMGRAVESVPPKKIEKIHAALEEYCARENLLSEKIRIDLVAIDGESIDHIIGIF